MNSKKHYEITGAENTPILTNLKKASQIHHSITVRIPLIPGFNDDYENIVKSAEFVRNLKSVSLIEILPYFDFGKSKYEMLDLEYKIPRVRPPTSDLLRQTEAIIKRHGIECSIVQ